MAPPRASDARLNEHAWSILEQIELGSFADAERAIVALGPKLHTDPGVAAMQGLLTGWLERRRRSAATPRRSEPPAAPASVETWERYGPEAPATATPETVVVGPPAPDVVAASPATPATPATVASEGAPDPPAPAPTPTLSSEGAEALKREGIQLYSEGKVTAALDCWRRVLAAAPGDSEARKLVERAETVLRNQERS